MQLENVDDFIYEKVNFQYNEKNGDNISVVEKDGYVVISQKSQITHSDVKIIVPIAKMLPSLIKELQKI